MMSFLRRLPAVGLISASGLIAGCALFSKGDTTNPRFFSPEQSTHGAASEVAASGLELRLGGITSGSAIRQSFGYRDSDFELGYDDELLWTEKPEVYLRRMLARELFEERGIRRIVSGHSPTLEVELIAFEEIRQSPNRVRVTAAIILHDERVVRVEQTFTVDQPVSPGGDAEHPDAVVQASSVVLDAIVNQIADRVSEQLVALRNLSDSAKGRAEKPGG